MSDEDLKATAPGEAKSLFIFGRDITQIPCFRSSLLYGLYGGLGSGLGHFLFKSSPLAATNFAVYAFCGVTMVYWAQCRYQYSLKKFEMLRIQEMLRNQVVYEGTQVEKDVDAQFKEA